MAETPRAPPPARPLPPVPQPETPPPESSPSTPGEDYHTPTPSLDEAREETPPWQQETNGGAAAKSPSLSPVRLPTQHRVLPPNSPTGNDHDGAAGQEPAPARRQQLELAPGLVRTPSHGSLAKSPSPSPSPTPPSPLTPAPTPAPKVNSKSGQSTPKRAEAWKQPASPIEVQFDPIEEAVTSPLRLVETRLDHQRAAAPAAVENGGTSTTVPRDVVTVAPIGERRTLAVALRLATAVLSLASFAVMASARTSGWEGDHYGRYVQYRYAIGVNVIVCIYSIAQALGQICSLVSSRFIFRSMSSYYFSLFLDQVLAYLLMSASSTAASRNDLWVSRFGQDPFNKKISSAVWLSFLGFIALAANSLISTANLFRLVR